MGNLESTSLPNIACVAPCNSAMAFSNVITKVSQNIDRNEERAQDSEMKDKFSVEWKQVYLRFIIITYQKINIQILMTIFLICLMILYHRYPWLLTDCCFGFSSY